MSNFWDNDPVAPAAVKAPANFWEADPVAEHPSVAADVVKSGGTGLAKGVIGLAGLPGDAAHLLTKGSQVASDYIANKLGFDKSPAAAGDILPTSERIQKGVEGVTGDFYKPKTTAGEYAQTIGEFAPGALGGGEGLMARIVKQVVAPALASETAGQLTHGTAAEPYARVAGAVGGGGLASVLSKAPKLAAPTVEELKDAARSQYKHPDVKDVQIHPDAVNFLHNWIQHDLENGTNSGFRAANEPKTFAAISELSNPNSGMARSVGSPASIDDIQSVRKVLGRIADDRSPTGTLTSEAVAANRAIEHVNNFLENLRQPDLIRGNAQKAGDLLKEAGSNWGAAKRAEEVATKAENARIQAASTYGGGNINNATRQALRPLAKNDFQKARGFNQDERDALSRAVEGNWAGNTARQVGKLGPDTGLKGLEHLMLAFKTGGASIPFSVAAFGAKMGGDAATRRAVNNLGEMLRTRSPLHQANLATTQSPTIASRVTPGVTLPNPNYVPLPAGQGPGKSALINALLASTAPRTKITVRPGDQFANPNQ